MWAVAVATFVWDGDGGNDNFSNNANWEGDPASGPDANDIVIFRTADPGAVDLGGAPFTWAKSASTVRAVTRCRAGPWASTRSISRPRPPAPTRSPRSSVDIVSPATSPRDPQPDQRGQLVGLSGGTSGPSRIRRPVRGHDQRRPTSVWARPTSICSEGTTLTFAAEVGMVNDLRGCDSMATTATTMASDGP